MLLYKVVGCVSVVNYKVMNDRFMEKSILSTKELLSIGFNSHDLTKLVEEGKLKRNGRGYYSLPIADRELVYPFVNVIERVKGGEAVVMLEPLEKNEANIVLDTISNFSNIRPLVVDEDGKLRIILRSICKDNFTRDISDMLERADCLYDSEFYDAYINVIETLLPSIDNPCSDLYLKLGFSYQQLLATDVNNASKMIDYLTVATLTSDDGKGKMLLNFMKTKYNYDGIKIKDNFPGLSHVFDKTIQYKFSL